MNAKRTKNSRSSRRFSGFSSERQTAAMEERYASFEDIIRSIPVGKVATYGQIAEAAGYPRGHRLVARFLRDMSYSDLPWQRVVGACGYIKTSGKGAEKQYSKLRAEKVVFVGKRVDMDLCGHTFDS